MGRIEMKVRAAFCAFVTAAAVSNWAHAEDSRELVAEARFVEGVRLMKSGQCQQALARFAESQELSPASGTLLDMGYCEAALGHLSRAWLHYRRALSLAESSGKPKHAQMAKEKASQLEGQLGWLSLRFQDSRAWQLSLDDEPLPDRNHTSELPIDPGKHRLVGRADGAELQRTIEVAAAQHVVLDIAADASAPPANRAEGPARETTATPPARPVPAVPPPAKPQVEAPPSRAPLYALIAGGALFGSGIAVFAHARYRYDSADCPDNHCTGAPKEQRVSAQTESYVSYALAGAGLALAGVGLALRLTDTNTAGGVKASLSLDATPTQCSLALRSAF